MPATVSQVRAPSLVVLCFLLSAVLSAQNGPRSAELTAHEWGTFTSIAGTDGRATKWSALRGSADLPSFVEHLSGAQFKIGLRGRIRMETPVLYFYSPQETSVSVKVRFSKGLITEWYPSASHLEPDLKNPVAPGALFKRRGSGSIGWDSVTVSPSLGAIFPHGDQPGDDESNQYYAARETAAAPLVVHTSAGDQQEKFLFYRGVSTFSVPISVTVAPEGQLEVRNLGQEDIPSVILFERRGDKLGYRLGGAVPSELTLDPPELTATLESLSRDLQDILTRQGLYPDEARAMIETWRQSWFEEGSRLFYIVPGDFLNSILPINITPAPAQTVRVFVGRMELVTPATTEAMKKILSTHDLAGLEKYNRFLEPILSAMKAANPGEAAQMDKDLDLTYRSPLMPQQPAN